MIDEESEHPHLNDRVHLLRTTFSLLFSVLALLSGAQRLDLNFEPQGQIIKFHFDSLTLYTDTTSLFHVYDEGSDLKDYDLRVKNLVKREVAVANSDTVTFSGNFIPFDDGIANEYQKDWYIKWAVLHLIKAQKVKLYDKHGQPVHTIRMKKVGKKRTNYVKRSYLNNSTNEELIFEVLFIRISDPPF